MDTIESIMQRISVREYADKEISANDIETILKAGMAGPSCVNSRDWAFIVVRSRDTLNKMADANGRSAEPLRTCRAAILICGDLERAYAKAPEYWTIDCSIAAQNTILAANALGIGSVWLGTWPQAQKVRAQAELFALPPQQIPHSIIAFGFPKQKSTKQKLIMEEDRIHYEKW